MSEISSFLIDKIEEISFSTVEATDSLWKEKVLDSITIIELIVEIEKEYGFKVPFADIEEENFETVELIVSYVNSKKA
jgi:acyl carrier protein